MTPETTIILLFQLAILLLSVMLHEIAHGLMALKLGDQTAKLAGRLTLNPVKHLDPVGSFFVPLLLFLTNSPVILGWAKPVPYNPNLLFKDYKYGPLKVALAGPATNLLIALVLGLLMRFGVGFLSPVAVSYLSSIVILNILLAIFNLMPIPPLDGSKILTTFLPPRYRLALESVGFIGIFVVLIFLFFFFNFIIDLSYSIFNLIVGPGV
ncbi:MAG TPA: site-2 protease family protein [Candidatus Paceibacterota bacterium]